MKVLRYERYRLMSFQVIPEMADSDLSVYDFSRNGTVGGHLKNDIAEIQLK
jgi:hypothetical protein